jgi:cobalt transport protein cbiQ
MFRDVTFGQYYFADSFVHRMDARIKMLLCLTFMVAIFFVTSFAVFGLIVLFLLLTIAVAKVPLGSILRSIKGIFVLLLFTAILNLFFTKRGTLLWSWWILEIYDGGIIFAAKMLLRLTLLVIGSNLLTLTTTPVELTHAIESLLAPLNVVKFPVKDFALIMSLTLSFIPSLIEETDRIVRAQKARGADFDTGSVFKRAKAFVPILIPLLVGGFRRADELANAMNSRCYEGSTKRTRLVTMKLSWRDAVGAFVTLSVLVTVFVVYCNSENWANITWLYF